MPYVKREARARIIGVPFPDFGAINAGELNFIITKAINKFIGDYPEFLSYEKINAAIGALECAKLELYRRVAAPHEDRKIAENGDVYNSAIVRQKSEYDWSNL